MKFININKYIYSTFGVLSSSFSWLQTAMSCTTPIEQHGNMHWDISISAITIFAIRLLGHVISKFLREFGRK